MQQLSVPFAEKLDEPLAQLCNDPRGFAPSERVPVVVRCDEEGIAHVAERVKALGGEVRHRLRIVSAIAAWIPLCAIEELAQEPAIRHMELTQSFTIA